MLASAGQNLLHPVFLPEVSLADELDLDASVRRHLFGVLPNPVPERLGEPSGSRRMRIFLSNRNDVIPPATRC